MKRVVGLVDVHVHAANEVVSELSEYSIVRDGRHIRGCNMMHVIDRVRNDCRTCVVLHRA